MLAWALRMVIVWSALCGAGLYAWEHRTELLGLPGERSPVATAPVAPTSVSNTMSFRPDRTGHVYLNAALNGAQIRFIVDTGASFVTLRMEDARAAGLGPSDLHF